MSKNKTKITIVPQGIVWVIDERQHYDHVGFGGGFKTEVIVCEETAKKRHFELNENAKKNETGLFYIIKSVEIDKIDENY